MEVNRDAIPSLISEWDSHYRMEGNDYNFRCIICGDSRKDHRKRRGWFLYNSTMNTYNYFCFNEGCSRSLWQFVNEYYPAHRSNIFSFNFSNKNDKYVKPDVYKKEKTEIWNNYRKQFEDFMSNNKFDVTELPKNALDYLNKRKLPENFISKCKWAVSGSFKNRIVMPFVNEQNGSTYYLLARTLQDNHPCKYLNIKDFKPIYNLFSVDDSQPYYVLEGLFDSLLTPNSVAILGAEEHTLGDGGPIFGCLNRDNVRFLQDNDPRGVKSAKKYVKCGLKVFKWREFLHMNRLPYCKDVSDVNKYIKFSDSNYRLFFTDNISVVGMMNC